LIKYLNDFHISLKFYKDYNTRTLEYIKKFQYKIIHKELEIPKYTSYK